LFSDCSSANCRVSVKGESGPPTERVTMRRLLLVPLLGSLLLAGSGCGTVLNFFSGESEGPKRVYGGVRMDCQFAAEQLKDCRVDGPPLVLFALFDLPLSAFGDTLTLPLVVAARWRDLMDDRPPSPPGQAPAPPGLAPAEAPR
jgi:uncharacterized protein YceK